MEFLKLIEDWKGYQSLSEVKKPENWETKLTEVSNLIYGTDVPQHRREYLIREALTTSDFPYLFGDILDRSVLGIYQTVPAEWKRYMQRKVVRDFRTARMFAIDGGDTLLDVVSEKGEYPASSRDEIYYQIAVKKYGRQFDISWEAMINDDLGALDDTPRRFAMAASNTEHYLAVLQYCADVGAHVEGVGGNLYELGINAQQYALNIANLETAISDMRQFQSRSGMPMFNRPKYLVVPPALEFTARQILTSANKMWLSAGGGDGTITGPMPTTNVVAGYGLELIVDDFLPYCHTVKESGYGDDAWYLFADPAQFPALAYGQLAGHERPELCMKSSDKVSIGGGDLGPMTGDFATDNIFYRLRLVFGMASLDWRATWMSVGAQSS